MAEQRRPSSWQPVGKQSTGTVLKINRWESRYRPHGYASMTYAGTPGCCFHLLGSYQANQVGTIKLNHHKAQQCQHNRNLTGITIVVGTEVMNAVKDRGSCPPGITTTEGLIFPAGDANQSASTRLSDDYHVTSEPCETGILLPLISRAIHFGLCLLNY